MSCYNRSFHCKMVVNRIAAKEKGMLKQLESSGYTNDDFKQLNPILYKKWKSCIEDSQALRSQSHLYQYISGNYLTSFTSGLQYDLKIGKGQSKHEACVSLFSNNAKNTQKISLIPDPIMSRTISPCSTLKGGYELNEVSI
ncbi:unnamed protein product [Moneuplotes crassus]|uniref:Uncharacterized protein n=1 Tax=Euplotes crassus TaxID=5936 RepID=A0AAD2D8J5_EUPCR|nr:unnamed protein product [Moneuplotes crassus]